MADVTEEAWPQHLNGTLQCVYLNRWDLGHREFRRDKKLTLDNESTNVPATCIYVRYDECDTL